MAEIIDHPTVSRILDDDRQELEIFDRKLRELGVEECVLHAVSDEFIELIDMYTFVVCIDYYLGSETGIDVLRKAKEKKPDLYVILMSGGLSEDIVTEHINNRTINKYVKKEGPDYDQKIAEAIQEGRNIVRANLIELYQKNQKLDRAESNIAKLKTRLNLPNGK